MPANRYDQASRHLGRQAGANMQESQIIKELQAEARAEDLLQILQQRFKAVPDDLRAAILAVKDLDQLTPWIGLAVSARTLRTSASKPACECSASSLSAARPAWRGRTLEGIERHHP